jgi:uncharacterized damage-inducible protein DinB
MTKFIFEAFSEYNKTVNANMNSIIKELTEEEWDRPFPSYWKSIHELCSHIFISDYTWLSRFCEFCNFTELKRLLNDHDVLNYNSGKKMFETITEYITMREELDGKIIAFVQKTNDEQLSQMMPLDENGKITMEGKITKKPLGVYLLHVFNHATHHRAQISVYLDMLGKKNEYSDIGW